MMAEKVLTVRQALTITDVIELLENMTKQQTPSYSLTVLCLGRWSRTALNTATTMHIYERERERDRERESRDCSVPCILYFSRWNLSIPFHSVPFQILVTTFMTLLARQGYNLPALPSLYCLLSRWAVLVFPDTYPLHTRAGGRVCRSRTETRVVLAIKCG